MAEIQWGNIQNQDLAGRFQGGYAFGAQVKQQRQAEQDNNALRGLAPGVIAGEPGAYEQAAAINPEAAGKYQGAGDQQLRRLSGAIDYFDQALKSGDDRMIQARFREISPFLSKITGQPAPAAYTPEMAPAFEQVKTKIAMATKGAQGRVQSTYVDGEGNRVAIMADGTQKVLGANDAGMSQQTISIPGPDGRPRQYTFDKRTGNYVPAGEGGQSSALGAPPEPPAATPAGPTVFRTSEGQLFDVSQVTDPAMQANIMSNPSAYGLLSDAGGGSVTLPQRDVTPQQFGAGSSPFIGRTPEEEAAAVARAKGGVELDLLPQTEAIKRDSAIQQAVGIETGKNAAERAAAAPATIATMQNSLDSIDALLADPELGSIVGLSSLNPLNKIPGSKARGLAARADQVAGQAFLAAFNQLKGGGAITEREGAAATAAMARLDRSQSEEDYRQALSDLRDAIAPAMERARQQAAGGQQAGSAPSAQRAVNPQTGEVLELRNGQWVRAQ